MNTKIPVSKKIPLGNESYEELIPQEELKDRVAEIAKKISRDYEEDQDKPLILLGVLTGACILTADLARGVKHSKLNIDFVSISSYENENTSNGSPKVSYDGKLSIEDANVIIVEDIVDTGYTIEALLKQLQKRGAHSVRVCSLLSKPDRREVKVDIDYLGFEIPDKWVVGYGLDDAGKGRNLSSIFHKVNI